MIDIETLDTVPGAVIFEIGALEFDPHTGETFREFHESIRIEESLHYGLTQDAETLEWWAKQGGVPMPAIVFAASAVEVWDMLSFWIKKLEPEAVWAWGSHFDIPIMEAAWRVVKKNRKYPWAYWQVRDARTVWKIAMGERKHAKASHCALSDCRDQVADLHRAFRKLQPFRCMWKKIKQSFES